MEIYVQTIDPAKTEIADVIPEASFVALHGPCRFAPEHLGLDRVKGQVHGATSCRGAMTNTGFTDELGVFAIKDADGAYGTGFARYDGDAKTAACNATIDALKAADHLGETPDLIWVSGTPGYEEEVILGIESVVGSDTPVIGGSAADNTVAGDWFVFDRAEVTGAGVVISVMFPSKPVSVAYHNGYAPTSQAGRVTDVHGRRVIAIDGRPAVDVYREWTEDAVDLHLSDADQKSILSEATLLPLGRKVSDHGDVVSYLLAHPATFDKSGAIEFFANIERGEVLTQMTGTKTGLVERAGRVAALARSAGGLSEKPVSGALMVYCGGCMLSVGDRISDVAEQVSAALGAAPFLGTFTFGEQGSIVNVGNRHGNLMISCIVFG